MRIGLFTDTYTPEINGVVSSICILQQQLEEAGHTVYIVTNHKALLKSVSDGKVLRLPGLELKWLYGYKLSTPYHFKAKEEVKNMNLDIIHVHTEFGVGIFARLVARSLGIPLISTYHTMYEDYTHYVNKFNISEIDKVTKKATGYFSRIINLGAQYIIAPSIKTKETLLRYNIRTNIEVIPTGLDLNAFNSDNKDIEVVKSIRKEYNIKEDDFVIVYLGRIAPEKSIDFVIECFSKVNKDNAKLMIVGDGPQVDDLKRLSSKLAIQDKVIFTGRKNREEVPNYYFASDVFVSASLTETQGMTFIEALAAGLPILVRPDEVLEELVNVGSNGYYFSSDDEFVSLIEDLMKKDKKEFVEFKKNAEISVKKYDAKIFLENVENVYKEAINNYINLYEVEKIRLKENYANVFVSTDANDELVKIRVSYNDFYSNNIQKGIKLDNDKIDELLIKSRLLYAKKQALKKIVSKDRTEAEVREYLSFGFELNIDEVNIVINELKEQGYINDYLYVISRIYEMSLNLEGKRKVYDKLIKKGISQELAMEELNKVQIDTEVESAMMLAKKLDYRLSNDSLNTRKKKIMNSLHSHGYSLEIANSVFENYNFEYDQVKEEEELLATMNKLVDKYKSKYQGEELKKKVMKYCLSKGYAIEMINEVIKKMECYDED